MKWISVKDALPVIPEGRYGLSVLIAEFDSMYDELCPGHGYRVKEAHYGYTHDRYGKPLTMYEGSTIEVDFMELWPDATGTGWEWGPVMDEGTHWMYLPEPPTREEN